MTTRDALNTKSDFDANEILIILKQKKAQLLLASNSKTAIYAKRENYNDQRDKDSMSYRAIKSSRRFASRRRRSNSSDEQGKCYLCEEHDHFARECTWLKVFQAITKATNARRVKAHLWKLVVECKNEMFVKRDNKTKEKSDRKNKTYAAKDQESDTKDSQIEKNDEEKICALFEELHNKILKNFWMKNIDVFSHMIDQLRLFSDNMNVIKRRIIRVEEKVLYSNQCETTIMRMKNDNFTSLTNVLYVSRLEVNLLFVKKTCQSDLKSEFNDKIFYLMNKHKRRIVETSNKNDIYIVEKLTFNIKEFALASTVEIDQIENVLNANNINLKDVVEFFSKNIRLYQLWHRRLEHSKEFKIKTLHIVTTLSKVSIAKKHEIVCEVCALIKLINRLDHQVSERALNILTLLFIDICEQLLASREDYVYFLEIVDNYFRRTWIICLKNRFDVIEELNKWKRQVKLDTTVKIKAVRSDNALELKQTLDN